MTDIRVIWDPAEGIGDWNMAGAFLETGHDLETSVLVSLLTWRVADPSSDLPQGVVDPQGWWADAFTGDPIGSGLWELLRSKKSDETLRRAESYAKTALEWLIQDGVASAVLVEAEWQVRTRLAMLVTVVGPTGEAAGRYSLAWSTLSDA